MWNILITEFPPKIFEFEPTAHLFFTLVRMFPLTFVYIKLHNNDNNNNNKTNKKERNFVFCAKKL